MTLTRLLFCVYCVSVRDGYHTALRQQVASTDILSHYWIQTETMSYFLKVTTCCPDQKEKKIICIRMKSLQLSQDYQVTFITLNLNISMLFQSSPHTMVLQ